jgi:hypothetical protein
MEDGNRYCKACNRERARHNKLAGFFHVRDLRTA